MRIRILTLVIFGLHIQKQKSESGGYFFHLIFSWCLSLYICLVWSDGGKEEKETAELQLDGEKPELHSDEEAQALRRPYLRHR